MNLDSGLKQAVMAQKTHFAMGTVMSHRVYGERAEACLDALRDEITALEGFLSRFLPESDISRINRSAGVKSEKVNAATFEVLSKAARFSAVSAGLFDLTIAPLVALWNVGGEAFTRPGDAEIQAALSLVNFRDLILDPWEVTAGLRHAGQAIDLGGIGKGYAGDRVLEVYREFGIQSAYSNLGGNVVTLGARPDGSPWRIGIQHPRTSDRLIGAVSVAGQSVVTSGDYQRFACGRDGQRYHHILNPLTGYPSDSGLVSVTIVADCSMTADALSTMVFLAGLEEGEALLKRYPETEAVLVTGDMEMFVTGGLMSQFQTDGSIRVKSL